MKILSVSFSDIRGGAARAAYRLHRGLCLTGVDSLMLVQQKDSDDQRVVSPSTRTGKGFAILGPELDRLPASLYPNRVYGNWSVNWLPNGTVAKINSLKPDLCHLNWVGNGMLPMAQIQGIKCPVVWTFHDMWPFTGGCHYDNDCGRYMTQCSKCPQLKSWWDYDISRWGWGTKKRAWQRKSYTVITPSRWMAGVARSSAILHGARIETIPYGIDTGIFKPVDKDAARRILNLPLGKKIILFGAFSPGSDKRKGAVHLCQALNCLKEQMPSEDLTVAIFGHQGGDSLAGSAFPVIPTGYLHDEQTLTLLYSAADLQVVPSLQDNLPNTVLESMACGTPVVAFNIGGMPDMIDHKMNGYLAEPFVPSGLADGIKWTLHHKAGLGSTAREKIMSEFTTELSVKNHMNIYRQLIEADASC